jgi:hypothetical protein
MPDSTQDFINAMEAASAPAAPAASAAPTLPAAAQAQSLQGTAQAAPGPAPTAPMQTLPAAPMSAPVAPLRGTHPFISSFEQAHGASFGHDTSVPPIQKYDVSVAEPTAPPPPQPNLWDKMIAPVGKFAQGLGGGALGTADTAVAGMQTPFRLAAQKYGIPQEAAPDMQQAYEQGVDKETKDDPAYQAGKAVGELGGNVAEGLLLPGGAGAKLGGMFAQGAYFGGSENAKEQLQKTGHLDPAQLAQSAAMGGATSAALGAVGAGIGKVLKGAKDKSQTLQKLGKIGSAASESAGEPIEAYRAKMKEKLAKETQRFEHDQLNRLWNHLKDQEPKSSLQTAQRAALDKVKGHQAEIKQDMAALQGKGLTTAETEASGPYRLAKRDKGYEAIEYAKPLHELQHELSPKTFGELKEGVEAISEALAFKKHFENETEVYAKHAMSLAKTAAQKAKVEAEEKVRLTSGAADKLAKAKSELYLKQQQSVKAKTKELRDELVAQLNANPKKAHAELRQQITALDEALQRLNTPEELFNIPNTKHLYGIANRAHIAEEPKDLAPTFGKAYKQFVESANNLKAASKQYTALTKHFLPAFENAEKELQEKGDKLARVWVKYSISHPYTRKGTTEFAVGTQHKSHITYLHGVFAQELDQIDKAIRANEENLVKELAYKVGGVEKLTQQSGKEALATLKRIGALHPAVEKIGLAAVLGLPSLDNPAKAADDEDPQERHRFFGNASMALLGTILLAKYGHVAAQRLTKSPGFFYMRAWANTRDLAHFADKIMGINPFTHPDACLGGQLKQLQGKIVEALFLAPDDHEYLVRAAFKEIDGKLLSPQGQKYAKEIHDMGKTFKGFVANYSKEFNKVYEGKTPADQAYLKPVKDAVDFIHNAVSPGKSNSLADTHLAKLFANASKAWFSLNPQQFIANFFDVAISGPLKIGPVATAQGYKAYGTNPVLRGLVDKLVISGPRSEALQEASTKMKPLSIENLQARILSLGSMKHYFDTHPREMRAQNLRKWEDFAQKLMAGQLKQDTTANAFIQLSVDLVDTLGHDPLSITKGPMSRSPMGYVVKFVSQPERYARLLVNNVTQGNLKWIAASLAVLWQFGGHAAEPKILQIMGWLFQPEDQAKMQALMDQTSMGQQLLGDMSRKVDWDPFLFPFMGAEAPGLDNILEIMGDLPKVRSQLASVAENAYENPHIFLEDKYDPEALKAQKALRAIINDISMLYPMLGPIPLQSLSAAAYYLPDVMSGSTEVGIPSPYGLGNAKPLKSPELKTFDGAQGAALRGMLRLGAPPDVSLYRTAETGLKLGKDDEGLETLKSRSGIY